MSVGSVRRVRQSTVARAAVAVAVAMLVPVGCAPGRQFGGNTGQPNSVDGGSANGPRRGTDPTCREPAAGEEWERRSPESVGVDARTLDWALAATDHPFTATIRVYRHNCLIASAGPEGATSDVKRPIFSMTKSVVALGVGRAVTLGLVDVDDPIGDYFDGLDPAHAAITVEDLLTQSSGLRFAWANDLAGSLEDSVGQALAMPLVAEPGTLFEYAQTTVTVLTALVERAAGRDFQEFMSAELFEPIGIEPGTWSWMRDGAGNTQGYAWLDLTARDVARLATLMVHQGMWGDERLIDADYLAAMSTSSESNPGYGYLAQVNTGDWFVESFGATRREGARIRSAPTDTIHFSGFLDQDAFMVPSLDLVIVRMGLPMDSRWRYEIFKRLLPAFPDAVAAEPGAPAPPPLEVTILWSQIIDVGELIKRLATNGAATNA